jgi:hypothetical protein
MPLCTSKLSDLLNPFAAICIEFLACTMCIVVRGKTAYSQFRNISDAMHATLAASLAAATVLIASAQYLSSANSQLDVVRWEEA